MRIEEPGVHTIVLRGVDVDGNVLSQRSRVLVSTDIPPNAVITEPRPGARVILGETVGVSASAAAAYGREVAELSLCVKEGDRIETGLNRVKSENYAPTASATGSGQHNFTFAPERPGMYMLQVGAVDNRGVVGESGHVVITVAQP